MRRLKVFLFGSPDRVIATISLALGVISLIFSVYIYTIPQPLPLYIVARDLIFVALLIFLIMTLSIKYFKKDDLVERFRIVLAEQSRSHHQMIHKFRDHYFSSIRIELAGQKTIEPSKIENIKVEYFRKVTHTVLTDTRDLLLSYFATRGFRLGDDLTVTVKIIVEAEEAQQILNKLKGEKADILNNSERYIITGYRDPYTWEKKPERNEIKQLVYRVDEENTTFDVILNQDKSCYFCNGLQAEFIAGKYRNQNPNWQKSYNSVLAVPIRFRHLGNPAATILYGVLSVDSLNKQKYELFDEIITFNMVATSADVLAMMFGHLDILQITMQLLKGESPS
jgi:hypothetical protein